MKFHPVDAGAVLRRGDTKELRRDVASARARVASPAAALSAPAR